MVEIEPHNVVVILYTVNAASAVISTFLSDIQFKMNSTEHIWNITAASSVCTSLVQCCVQVMHQSFTLSSAETPRNQNHVQAYKKQEPQTDNGHNFFFF